MTREEQIRKAAYSGKNNLHAQPHPVPGVAEMVNEYFALCFKEGAEWADSHPHWIPVEERLPEKRGHYLVYSQFGDVWLSEWMQDKEGRWDWYVAPICVGIISKVTHWMPLPEALRKEE